MLYIFDWDGTLVRSLDHIVESIDYAAGRIGLPSRPQDLRRSVIGLGLEEALSGLYPEAGERERDLLLQYYKERYLELDRAEPTPPYEGVEETLDHLLGQGHQLAVATGKARLGLERVMNNLDLGRYFVATRCADEARSKPHPLMLQQLLAMTGYRAEDALMVGDTDFDLNMAKQAGVGAVGVTYGAHPVARLRACQPIRLIADIRELREPD